MHVGRRKRQQRAMTHFPSGMRTRKCNSHSHLTENISKSHDAQIEIQIRFIDRAFPFTNFLFPRLCWRMTLPHHQWLLWNVRLPIRCWQEQKFPLKLHTIWMQYFILFFVLGFFLATFLQHEFFEMYKEGKKSVQLSRKFRAVRKVFFARPIFSVFFPSWGKLFGKFW